jgi:hypothetical protein
MATSFEKHVRDFAETVYKVGGNIRLVMSSEIAELKELEEQSVSVAREGIQLLQQFKGEEETRVLAEHSETHDFAEKPIINFEKKLIDAAEKELREIHTKNDEVSKLIKEEDYAIRQTYELSRKLAELFEGIRSVYPTISDPKSIRKIYEIIRNINIYTEQKLAIIRELKKKREIKEAKIREIQELRARKQKNDEQVKEMTRKVIKFEKKDRNLMNKEERKLEDFRLAA